MSDRQMPFIRLPSRIVDDSMPTLTGAQLKVLLVVVRQTTGWGKARDWMTQSYLMRATGLASAAVSGAVDALVRRRLIMVTSAQGTPLETAADRRRCSRLFFVLGAESSEENTSLSELKGGLNRSQSEVRKAKTTTDTFDNRCTSARAQAPSRNHTSPAAPSTEIQPLVVHGPSAAYVAEAMRKG